MLADTMCGPSVGRAGVPNAQAESFWATLKVKLYDRFSWPTRQHARVAVDDWIERAYNRRRRHSSLEIISPVEFETSMHSDCRSYLPRVHLMGHPRWPVHAPVGSCTEPSSILLGRHCSASRDA